MKNLQKKITKIFVQNAKRDKILVTDDYLFLKLTEEAGEMAQAFLVHKKRCRPEKYTTANKSKKELAKEIADVISLCMVIAERTGINTEEAINKKWITREWVK